MSQLLPVLRCAVPTLYAATVLLYGLTFLGRGEWTRRFARPAFWSTLAVHFLFLITFVWVNGRIPLAALPEVLTVVAFTTALAYFYVETRTNNTATGFFALGLAALLQFAASGRIALVQEVSPLLRQPAFGLHTGMTILGYSAFAVSAVYGFLFLLLYHELKSSRFGLIYRRLPALDVLAKMNIRSAVLGLASLSVGMVSGIVWASRLHPGFLSDPMFLMTVLVWLVYAGGILAHYSLGWRGKPTIYLTICGFVLMGAALAAVRVFLKSFHSFDVLTWNLLS